MILEKKGHLAEKNFIIRMLYKNAYYPNRTSLIFILFYILTDVSVAF